MASGWLLKAWSASSPRTRRRKPPAHSAWPSHLLECQEAHPLICWLSMRRDHCESFFSPHRGLLCHRHKDSGSLHLDDIPMISSVSQLAQQQCLACVSCLATRLLLPSPPASLFPLDLRSSLFPNNCWSSYDLRLLPTLSRRKPLLFAQIYILEKISPLIPHLRF